MTITLIRHGQTPGNALRRYIGTTDEPLSEQGVEAASQVGSDPSVKTVYVTPLLRTRQTAEILFPNARQVILAALQEMDFGIFENKSADDMVRDDAYQAWVDSGCLEKCPNGESMADFSDRVCGGFARIMEEQQRDAFFVVHGGTIMAILSKFGRPQKNFYDFHVKNCQGFRCTLAPGADGLPFTLTNIEPIR